MLNIGNWHLLNVLKKIFAAQSTEQAKKAAARDPHHGVAHRTDKRGHTKPVFRRAQYSPQEKRSRRQMATRARAVSGMKR